MAEIAPLKSKGKSEVTDAHYKLLVDSVKDYAIFMLDPEGYITTWNAGAEKIKGYAKKEIIHKHFSIFYTEEALKRNHPAYELKVAKKVGRFEEEGWRVKKDGTQFWANVVISAMYNDKNELTGFAKVTRDLTERKNLEDKLRQTNLELKESEEQSRLLIEGVKDYAIFLLTPEGNIATWNEGAKRIKGYTAEEIIGKHFSQFYTAPAIESQYPQFELAKALVDGRFEDEGWRVKKDGSKFWANVIITPIYNAENLHIGFTKVTRDLTERVRNEELMKKNLELHKVNINLDNFVYTASHDLKSPVSNLEGLLSVMEKKIGPKLEGSEKQIFQMMGNSVQKLNNTIKNLVDLTKSQKNQDEKVEEISLKEVLEDVKEEISTAIANSRVEIQEDFKVKSLIFARASLRSIVYNLLTNAIKYRSEERLPKIKISTSKEGSLTILSIKDNGMGLTKTQGSKLFGMFKRFHTHVEGTGIGLYIVKRTMENAGGRVEVNSTLNEGTEFKLYFNK